MRLVHPPKYQFHTWLFAMPVATFILCYILYGHRLFTDWRIAATSFPIIQGIGYISWFLHFQYDHYLRQKFPLEEQTKQRILYKALVNLFVMTPSVLFIFFVFSQFRIWGYRIQKNDLFYGYLVGLSVNVIFETLWEVLYIINRYKETASEEELLKQMQLQQEYENLKQKVNPHFLYNCFNTLLSLIPEDKLLAEQFLDELSKVYRYLLKTNENSFSTLEKELNFIQSYANLLKTRYGNGFFITLDIKDTHKDYLLPSLSLQLLVENVIKHNVISKHQPIRVSIATTDNHYLIIENNLIEKIKSTASTGIGLTNIKEKYKLLNRVDITISKTKTHFSVTLPLLPAELILNQIVDVVSIDLRTKT